MSTFERAYAEYGKALRHRDTEDQKFCWEEYCSYVEATKEAHLELQELQTELQEACRRYVEAVQGEGEQPAHGPAFSAYTEYLS